MGEHRPLKPLSKRRRRWMWVLVGSWLVVSAVAFAAVADGDPGMLVLAIGGIVFAAVWAWEIRRRSDPARTAGWGRPQGYRGRG